jgi:uncharacterized protein
MPKVIEIRIRPNKIEDLDYLKECCAREMRADISQIQHYRIIRKSIDSRGQFPKFVLRIEVFLNGEIVQDLDPYINYHNVRDQPKVLIVGSGPAGYFAALRCLELGMKPIVIDRGKDVRERRRDLRQIQQFHEVNPNSNYCFGEGGAGTYSDGKLYTRANKRGNVQKILQILVDHGADSEIMIDAHPHIGSNRLPKIVAEIRATIEKHGGEVHFNSLLTDFIIDKGKMIGAILSDQSEIYADATILATGHSARDIYVICQKKNIQLEFKPFALGVRIEHPQSLIDEIQYNQKQREEQLPAASYGLTCQVGDQGVFSFCMCPGGLIVPAATSPGELVVNGMSLSRRDSPFANAGTVVTVDQNPTPHDPFGGMNYQAELERKMFAFGDGSQKAPAQKLTDFAMGRLSTTVGSSSYIPGIYSAPMHELLPAWIYKSLSKAVQLFDKKMKGYYTDEAHVIGLESRTSSTIRIPRDEDTLMNPDVKGLFPCGEGGGYAGGILSAALDGERVAQQVNDYINSIGEN